MRNQLQQRAHGDLRVAGDHIRHRRTAALERDMHNVHARLQAEQFGAQMLKAADARRGVIQRTRFRFRQRNQFLG